MEKISLDEGRALLWHEEVRNELKLVTEINNKVAACVLALQEDDDPLIHVLHSIGEKIENYGNILSKTFSNAMDDLKSGIDKLKKAHEDLTADAEVTKSKIGGESIMLKYSQSFYQGKINELEGYASMLLTHIDNLKNYKSQLPEFWDDTNGLATGRALETAIADTKSSLTQIQFQLVQYNNIVEQYGGASEDTQQTLENVIATLDALSSLAPTAAAGGV